ncbi:iron ABC transporter permease [Acetobacteraceae bacterium KSS8]|uniref:Iron ABC transporter permease n=1 Tax=Endosaccharibacter trunci TaxID=2812733 RepID=A0ABT1W5T5_9PROT|nr:iron ABC transporter permease [Acetobacteraceae bacterium KSS8]
MKAARVSLRPPPLLLLGAAAAAALVLLPLLLTVWQATGADDPVGLLWRPLVGELLWNTVALCAVTVSCCAVLGTLCAWLVERTDLPGRNLFAVLAAVPLAIPPFITSYAWVSLSSDLQDFAGAVLVVGTAYMPLIYLPTAAALRGMDPAIEESGRVLGLSPLQCFVRLVLPQLRPALLGGMLLVALNVLVEFGAFALLRFRTFTTVLYGQYRTGLAGPDSALLACVLIGLCLLCVAGELRVRRGSVYASMTRGAARRPVRHRLGWMRWPALAFLIGLAVATLGVPLGMIGFWLFQHNSAATASVGVSWSEILAATSGSLGLALGGALTTLLLALPLGFLSVRFPGRAAATLERIAYMGQGAPGIVVALALITLALKLLTPLYQSAPLLILAYAILFLPLALVSVRAAFEQAQRKLEDAGRALGLGPFAVARRIVLPLAAPGLGAAASLVFAAVVTELTTTLLLSPIGTRTLATEVWQDTTTLAFAAAAPYAACMVLLSLCSTYVLARRFGRVAGIGL